MKNKDILALIGAGFLQISNHNLPSTFAYQVVKYRRFVSSAYQKIQETEDALLKGEGISDAALFNARYNELAKKDPSQLTAEESAELNEGRASIIRYTEQRNLLMEESVQTPSITRLPYDVWKTLQDENRSKVLLNGETRDILIGSIEDLLEGSLWIPPTE